MSPVAAAEGVVLPVPHGTQGRFIDARRDECGVLIGGILELVRQLTGRDLLREILDPIAGDFDAVSAMQQGWQHLAAASAEVEHGWAGLAGSLVGHWSGESAARADAALAESADRAALRARASALIAEQLGHLVQVGRSTTEVVCAALAFLDELIQDLVRDQLLGPVGAAVKNVIKARARIQRAITLIDRAVEAVSDLLRAVTTVIDALAAVQVIVEQAGAITRGVAHGVAGSRVDETARAGFGGTG